MASVNPLSRELVFKIVYYGPGLGGKTTTLEHIHATAKPEHRGKLVSLATPVDRTLYFDFLPVRLPKIRGMNVRLQLFTVPGQVYFNATRKLVLTGADGIVFVSDSQIVRADANLESLENLRENLGDQGRDLARLPIVFQHNKRDLPDLLPVEELDSMLNSVGASSFATCAKTGQGIYEVLEKISLQVLASFEDKLPETSERSLAASFEAIEGGIITALRDATRDGEPPSVAMVAHIGASDSETSAGFPSSDARPVSLPVSREEPERDLAESVAQTTVVDPAKAAAVSFAELWPEGEQEVAREIERAISDARYWRAIELCDGLVSRVLAATSGLLGSTETPQEPALIPLLLGLDGRRYLTFRSIVRDAREGGLITARQALEAYSFAINARIARSSIHQAGYS
jgi:signal recognition particle receptor subunit beta